MRLKATMRGVLCDWVNGHPQHAHLQSVKGILESANLCSACSVHQHESRCDETIKYHLHDQDSWQRCSRVSQSTMTTHTVQVIISSSYRGNSADKLLPAYTMAVVVCYIGVRNVSMGCCVRRTG